MTFDESKLWVTRSRERARLDKAIADLGWSNIEIQKRTGINQKTIHSFKNGGRITLNMAGRLALAIAAGYAEGGLK